MHANTTKSPLAFIGSICAAQCAAFVLLSCAVHAQATSPFTQSAAGETDSWQRFTVEIPAGTTALTVELSGGTGDADLYVRFGAEPSSTEFDCRPFRDSSNELCSLPNPTAGAVHIAVNAYTAYSGATLTATWGAGAAAPASTLEPWQQQMLDRHNVHRAQHCAPALTWDAEVAATAQAWAARCVFEHDAENPFGENMSGGQGPGSNPEAPVDSWYSEISEYDFARPDLTEAAGHFTQVVWKGSTKLGCGLAECPGSTFNREQPGLLYVCRYAEAGNMAGEFPKNVAPQGAACE